MICPACREEMIVVEFRKIELDYCVGCNGVWFDADELELLLGALGLSADRLLRPLAGKPPEEKRRCPRCRAKMEKALIGSGDDVDIDRCRRGHGLWFDGGELDTVVRGLQAPDAAGKVGSFLADVLLAGDREPEKGGDA